jgi:DNA-binding NarL/FixJ family response regulator
MPGASEPAETVTVLLAEVDEAGEPGFDALLEKSIAEHGGTPERRVGDGRLVSFRSARAALRCAVALQRALPFRIRAGVHTGELERRDGELQGRALLKAGRITALARAGEVLVSAIAQELTEGDDDIWFDDPVEVELRGLRGRHLIVAARWEEHARAPVRVVIADDAAIVRDGVAALLREHGFDVVATASDAAGLHAAVERHRPDVAVVDIRMPPTHTNEGLVAAEGIRASYPGTGVLVLSQHVEPEYALRLVRGDEARSGYLLKDRIADVDVLLDSVSRVARGGCVVDPGLTESLLARAEASGALSELTERERDVLGLLAQGLSNRGVAEQLVVTPRTVETHVSQIFLKLGLRDEGTENRRVAAVLTYLRAHPSG